MDDLRIEKETPGEIIYVSHFEGQPVHFMKDKRTGEITVNADDVVRAIGEADSFEAFLGSDKGLDFISDWKKEHFYEALAEGKADAALAASLFHYKELEIMDLKNYLADKGVSVRR